MRVTEAPAWPWDDALNCDRDATVCYHPPFIEVPATMTLDAAGPPSGAPSEPEGQVPVPRKPADAPALASGNQREAAAQLERDHSEYHIWVSDTGWWYATRRQPWARGQSATVHGPGPRELAAALAAEEAVTIGCAMTGAW